MVLEQYKQALGNCINFDSEGVALMRSKLLWESVFEDIFFFDIMNPIEGRFGVLAGITCLGRIQVYRKWHASGCSGT